MLPWTSSTVMTIPYTFHIPCIITMQFLPPYYLKKHGSLTLSQYSRGTKVRLRTCHEGVAIRTHEYSRASCKDTHEVSFLEPQLTGVFYLFAFGPSTGFKDEVQLMATSHLLLALHVVSFVHSNSYLDNACIHCLQSYCNYYHYYSYISSIYLCLILLFQKCPYT